MDLSQLPYDIQLILLKKYQETTLEISLNKRMVMLELHVGFHNHWNFYDDLMWQEDQDPYDWENSYVNSLRNLPFPDDLNDNEAIDKYYNTYSKTPDVDDWFWNHWANPSKLLVQNMK